MCTFKIQMRRYLGFCQWTSVRNGNAQSSASEEPTLEPGIYYWCFRWILLDESNSAVAVLETSHQAVSSCSRGQEKWTTSQQKQTREDIGVPSISCPGCRNTEHAAVNSASDFVRDDSVCSCDEMAVSILLIQKEERERDYDSLLPSCPVSQYCRHLPQQSRATLKTKAQTHTHTHWQQQRG